MVGVFPPRCPTLHPFGLSPHCPILHVFVISTSCCTKFMLPNMSPLGPYFIVFRKERLSLTCSVRTPQKEGCLQWPWCFNNSNKGGTRSPVAAEMISGILKKLPVKNHRAKYRSQVPSFPTSELKNIWLSNAFSVGSSLNYSHIAPSSEAYSAGYVSIANL